ncbi:D-alanine transaminase [Salsuginibacillus halophilus]|uniref:D-alanine aminotransferase n=1 Tax=Salsuginibacillus halophilus TaxID=517424 RepID=A0A2P8H7Z7_9BACI|nr:D-amino-acid transaminase [Salsuginibacillus halophilus]PSL42357.1 D-alanine transaminase [Salsuginibacillus halophilus]
MRYVLFHESIMTEQDVQLPLYDRGYFFGDGIYEVVRVYQGKIFALTPHLNRLKRSMQEMDMPMPYEAETLAKRMQEIVDANDLTNGYIYVQITRGAEERSHVYSQELTPVVTGFAQEAEVPVVLQQEGITAWVADDIRWLRCDIKTINLLGNIFKKKEAQDAGAQEAIMHRDGTVTEGASSNVFIVQNGTLFTHPANHFILNGITRQYVINEAEKAGIPVREEAFSLEELAASDEIFMTNTSFEVTPVTTLRGDLTANVPAGEITRTLQRAFDAAVEHETGAK